MAKNDDVALSLLPLNSANLTPLFLFLKKEQEIRTESIDPDQSQLCGCVYGGMPGECI